VSAPKRGMVAGQPIQTQAQSREFDEGYERVFGKGGGERGRFVYRDGQMVRVDSDWTDAERRSQTLTEELVHGKTVTTDGVDISSRKKRREYMQATGVTDSSDFSPGWFERTKKEKRTEQDRQRRTDMVETYKRLRNE
jgi:hypothetical protein